MFTYENVKFIILLERDLTIENIHIIAREIPIFPYVPAISHTRFMWARTMLSCIGDVQCNREVFEGSTEALYYALTKTAAVLGIQGWGYWRISCCIHAYLMKCVTRLQHLSNILLF